jgi:hypothetical protein
MRRVVAALPNAGKVYELRANGARPNGRDGGASGPSRGQVFRISFLAARSSCHVAMEYKFLAAKNEILKT